MRQEWELTLLPHPQTQLCCVLETASRGSSLLQGSVETSAPQAGRSVTVQDRDFGSGFEFDCGPGCDCGCDHGCRHWMHHQKIRRPRPRGRAACHRDLQSRTCSLYQWQTVRWQAIRSRGGSPRKYVGVNTSGRESRDTGSWDCSVAWHERRKCCRPGMRIKRGTCLIEPG